MIDKSADMIKECNSIVFFGGEGGIRTNMPDKSNAFRAPIQSF